MYKKTLIFIGSLIVVGGLISFFAFGDKESKKDTNNNSDNTNLAVNNNKETSEDSSKKEVVSNACGVFTASEIGNKLGVVLNNGSSEGYKVVYNSDNLPLVQCEWEEGDGSSSNLFTINLTVYNFATTEKATNDLNNSKITAGNLTYEQIQGVADDAIFARSGSGTPVQAAIYWRSGTAVYHMSAVKLAGMDRVTVENQLKEVVALHF